MIFDRMRPNDPLRYTLAHMLLLLAIAALIYGACRLVSPYWGWNEVSFDAACGIVAVGSIATSLISFARRMS